MVGSWNVISPDGTKSVKKNEDVIQNNTTYLKANLNLDHHWDTGSTTDGFHRQISTVDRADPTALLGATDGMYYSREKTTTEAPETDSQFSEPFFYHTPDAGVTNYYSQMGIRAMINVTILKTNGSIVQNDSNDWNYMHNIDTITKVASHSGTYSIVFIDPLPSNKYIVVGSAREESNDPRTVQISRRDSAGEVKPYNDVVLKTGVVITVFGASSATNSFDNLMLMIVGG